MLIIDDKVIDPAIFEKEFVCNLDACKGACCWEGDYGAPLEAEEIETLRQIYPTLKPYLSEEGIAAIEENGVATYVPEEKDYGTTLIENGACAFLTFDDNGMALCGIEKAYNEGKVDFWKPISCHLYPIRVEKTASHFYKMEYDRWEICSAACTKGEELGVKVYEFAKDPLIRAYGIEFYQKMKGMAEHLDKQKKS